MGGVMSDLLGALIACSCLGETQAAPLLLIGGPQRFTQAAARSSLPSRGKAGDDGSATTAAPKDVPEERLITSPRTRTSACLKALP